jgi:hypothetical protein
MPVYIPHYINTEEFKDFINDSFVFQDDSLVRLAVEDVIKSGLSPETLSRAQVTIFKDGKDKLKERLGYASFNGHPILSAHKLIEFPFFNEKGQIILYRYKLIPSAGDTKYLHPKGVSPYPYILPEVYAVKDKPHIVIYITEGEKKALKLLQHGIFAIGLVGVWSFKAGKDSEENEADKAFWRELDAFVWKGRTVNLAFDSDLWTNPNVRKALYELALKLHSRGAIVKIAIWLEEKGIDDYLAKQDNHEKALQDIEREAIEVIEFIQPGHYEDVIRALALIEEDNVPVVQAIKGVANQLNIPLKVLRNNIEKVRRRLETGKKPASNVIIAHPSYEIKSRFMTLGFRETVVIQEQPTERNLYVIATEYQYILHEEGHLLKGSDANLVFDERERLLIDINDRWNKQRLVDFINAPSSPVGVYEEIKAVLKEYIEFQNEAHYGLITAWIIATYFHRCFHAICFLFFYGKKQSGKSRSLDLLERLVFNGMKVKGVSVASMADSIDGVRGTFLNDQAESLSNPKNEETLGILADSYTVGGGKRRIVHITNQSRRVMEFETYGPKAFASIKEIDTDLKDRCILIPMLRATKDYPYPEAHLPIWSELRDKLYRLLLTRWQKVKEIYPDTGKGIIQRVRELWRPIETILKLENVAEQDVGEIKQAFLESMIETQAELTDREHDLFDALFELIEPDEEKELTVTEIAEKLDNGEINRKSLEIWIGKTLRQFSLYDSQGSRKNNKRIYRFSKERIKNILSRYQINGFNGTMAN